jgi:hypothetical protein
MGSIRRRIVRPADTPADVYDYWHQRWAEYLNQHHKEQFVQAGIINMSFTEKCPDCPDGSDGFHYRFASDGTLEFTDQVGEAIIEHDSYDIAYRLLGDADYDSMELLGNGSIRFVEKTDHFVKLAELMPLMREAFYSALADAERKFNIKMPKYL